ncbi:MAG: hypothetical protein II779_11205 [Clostridia bacterium]|nr:hypothetical protein [Clostridia bacterium]
MPKIMGVIIEWIVCICVLWGISFLSTLLHELGHAVGYMFSTGDRHWHIRVGSGKKLLETKALSVKLLVWDGCFAPAEDRMDTKRKRIITLSGGPVVSLALAAALLLLRFGNASFSSGIFAAGAVEFFVNYALYLNVFISVLSLLPMHCFFGEIKGMETDGLKILKTMRRGEEP